MCGGIVINYNKIPKKDLKEFLTQSQIERFEKTGKITSFFWDKRPFLPVDENGVLKLYDWGSRDKKLKFPKTGWAKKESILSGKWKWLKPKEVKIPVEKGYEKKVWFDFENGTDGILTELDNQKRVYMITEPADKIYLEKTHHDRMPPGGKEYS